MRGGVAQRGEEAQRRRRAGVENRLLAAEIQRSGGLRCVRKRRATCPGYVAKWSIRDPRLRRHRLGIGQVADGAVVHAVGVHMRRFHADERDTAARLDRGPGNRTDSSRDLQLFEEPERVREDDACAPSEQAGPMWSFGICARPPNHGPGFGGAAVSGRSVSRSAFR